MKSPFLNKNFGLLWIASLVSQAGDLVYAIAVAWMILERTKSPAAMGAFLAASYLPGFLISPWVGAVLDRSDRKRILVGSNLVQGVVVSLASIPVFLGQPRLGLLFAAAIALSVCSAFFSPAVRVAVPRIVPKDELVQANANLQLISGITSVAGPLAGAVLVGFLGYTGAFLVNAVSFFISGSLLAFMALPSSQNRELDGRTKDDAFEGLRFIGSQKDLLVLLALIFCVHFFFGSLGVFLPFLADRLPGKGVLNLGMLEASLGVGMIAGSLLLNLGKWEPRETGLFSVISVMGLGLLSMGLFQACHLGVAPLYAASMAVIGTAIAMASVSWTTLLQRMVPEQMAGRVFSIASASGNIALPIAYGLMGLTLEVKNLKHLFLYSGSIIAIIGALAAGIYAMKEMVTKPERMEDQQQ